jgi:NodT family efflux transporter outer membrane factor (OMF) lipoprotein
MVTVLRRGGALLGLVAGLVWTLAACRTVGPDYHRPSTAAINAPAAQGAFASGAGPAFSTEPLPPGWWRLYQDPTLDRLVQEAFVANTDLRVAEANLERSRALLAEAKAARQPNVTLNLNPSYTLLAAEAFLQPKPVPPGGAYDMGLAVSYQLDLFGGLKRGIEAARDDDEAVEAARDLARVSVAADIARAYADLCGAGGELVAARRSLALQNESLALTERLVRGGRGISLDVTRSQGQVDQLRSNIPALITRQRNALFRLATLTGKPPGAYDSSLEACVSPPRLVRPIPVGDGAGLLRRRPDVRQAEWRLAAATAQIGVQTVALYPDITLGGSVGSTGVLTDFLGPATRRYSIGPGVTWQLNRSVPRARIAQADAAQRGALAQFDGVVLVALRDVESALNAYANDLDRERSLAAAQAKAALAVKDARRLQTAGRSGALATLDAERALASADEQLAAERTRISTDQVGIFLSLGGGW